MNKEINNYIKIIKTAHAGFLKPGITVTSQIRIFPKTTHSQGE